MVVADEEIVVGDELMVVIVEVIVEISSDSSWPWLSRGRHLTEWFESLVPFSTTAINAKMTIHPLKA